MTLQQGLKELELFVLRLGGGDNYQAFSDGFSDGLIQGHYLIDGKTYKDKKLESLYDKGAVFGASIKGLRVK